MRDILSGSATDVTKAALLNACTDKRNAQIASSPTGQGLATRNLSHYLSLSLIALHILPSPDTKISIVITIIDKLLRDCLMCHFHLFVEDWMV